MTSVHEHTFHIPVPASHVQISSNGVYLALPYTRSTIGIWCNVDCSQKPIELEGHRKTISALCFSHKILPTLLCSADSDYIIVWNVERVKNCLDTGQQIRGQIIATSVGDVQCLSFSTDDILVAACVDKQVLVLDSRQEKTVAVLEGHTSQVHCAKFCPHYSATLVSTGADRTFKVWNISDSTLVYQSTILSSSPFLSLAMDPVKQHFAIGSSDGQVRIYDLTDGNGFRCLHQLDVSKLCKKMITVKEQSLQQSSQESKNVQISPVTISSRPRWERDEVSGTSLDATYTDEEGDSVELDVSIYDLMYNYSEQTKVDPSSATNSLPFLKRENTFVSDLLKTGPVLAIATTSCVLQVNANTLEPRAFLNLQEPMQSSSLIEGSEKVLSWAGNAVLTKDPNYHRIWCLIGSCFQNEVHLVELHEPSKDTTNLLQIQQSNSKLPVNSIPHSSGECETSSQLSVLSSVPLCENSPLKAQLVLKEKTPKKSQKRSSALGGTKVGLVGKKVPTATLR